MGTDTAENELRAELSVTITHMVLLTLRSSVNRRILRSFSEMSWDSVMLQEKFSHFSARLVQWSLFRMCLTILHPEKILEYCRTHDTIK